MRNGQLRLHPLDLVVAIRLLEGDATFQRLADALAVSVSQTFHAVRRLEAAQLLRGDGRRVNRSALAEFLLHGARYAFPPVVGALTTGVPTVHRAPVLADEEEGPAYVWPASTGEATGQALEPLYPAATALRERAPTTYRLLTLFDALRVGRTRDRRFAAEQIEALVGGRIGSP